jgi:methylenetetrahydrofolate dehydrogenase (NADP+) / methenyltetrahydrofolate cyclohydrolase
MGRIIDGRAIAKGIRADVKRRIRELGISPVLAIISVGENDASEVYIRQKRKAAEKVGIRFEGMHLKTTTTGDLMEMITDLNSNAHIHGILVQLPLPDTIDVRRVMEAIAPDKDVDGFHPRNYGNLLLGKQGLFPCTPAGIMRMLDHEQVDIQGMEVVIVNHSNIVGKPLALMMINRNATVSVCHVFTIDLANHTRNADILVTAAGVPGLIGIDMVKEGAVVIDVSMNRVKGHLCGDVVFDEVLGKASLVTPVPGGVGPMTVAMLMENTLEACRIQQK